MTEDVRALAKELRILLKKATPGSWSAVHPVAIDYRAALIYGANGHSLVAHLAGGGPTRAVDGPEERANAELIAAMRNALPALLDALERKPQITVTDLRAILRKIPDSDLEEFAYDSELEFLAAALNRAKHGEQK